jgi:DMSO/TMAO reductase YedYZ molybdopterin-dependent catalytic subunit
MTRRSALACLLGAVGTAPLLAAAARAVGQGGADGAMRIVRSARPQDFETPVFLLDSWLTPNDRFFVRSHLYTPEINLQEWRLTVDGEVDTPLSLTLEDLRGLPEQSRVVTIECAGNGRAFYVPPVAGVQWQKGAVGTARWTGVRLADVLARARTKSSARFVLLNGADAPIATIPDFVRQLPVEKALHPDTLLAYNMNGAPLPVANGFPLRAIVPGWEGAYAVKWLTSIRVLDREGDSFWIETAYRYPKRRIAPGAAVAPEDMAPVAGLFVKSLMTAPLDGSSVPNGVVHVRGFAWAGEANITAVDVSVDGGSTWSAAQLGSDRAPYAWRQFEYEWRPTDPGSYLMMSRATDDRGRTQPIVAQWNPSGYLWNAIDQVRVDVAAGAPLQTTGAAPGAPPVPTASESEPAILTKACLTCHDRDLIAQQRLARSGWVREVEKMMRWGAQLSDTEKAALVDYLAQQYPVR